MRHRRDLAPFQIRHLDLLRHHGQAKFPWTMRRHHPHRLQLVDMVFLRPSQANARFLHRPLLQVEARHTLRHLLHLVNLALSYLPSYHLRYPPKHHTRFLQYPDRLLHHPPPAGRFHHLQCHLQLRDLFLLPELLHPLRLRLRRRLLQALEFLHLHHLHRLLEEPRLLLHLHLYHLEEVAETIFWQLSALLAVKVEVVYVRLRTPKRGIGAGQWYQEVQVMHQRRLLLQEGHQLEDWQVLSRTHLPRESKKSVGVVS